MCVGCFPSRNSGYELREFSSNGQQRILVKFWFESNIKYQIYCTQIVNSINYPAASTAQVVLLYSGAGRRLVPFVLSSPLHQDDCLMIGTTLILDDLVYLRRSIALLSYFEQFVSARRCASQFKMYSDSCIRNKCQWISTIPLRLFPDRDSYWRWNVLSSSGEHPPQADKSTQT